MESSARSGRIVPGVISLLAVTCLALSGYVLSNRRLLDQAAPLLVGDRVDSLEGMDLEGGLVAVGTSSCALVHYTSRWCRFSRDDEPGFARLESLSQKLGCRTVVIAPSRADFFCASGAACTHLHLAHLTLRTAEGLRLEGTPTTFIVNKQRVSWLRSGTMREEDRVAADATLRPSERAAVHAEFRAMVYGAMK